MQNRRIVTAHLSADGPAPAPRVESNSMLAILSHVTTGRWAAVLPRALAQGLPLPAGVTARDLPGTAGHRVGLVVADRDPQPPIVDALLRGGQAIEMFSGSID